MIPNATRSSSSCHSLVFSSSWDAAKLIRYQSRVLETELADYFFFNSRIFGCHRGFRECYTFFLRDQTHYFEIIRN